MAFVAVPREADPYLLGEGGNCGMFRLPHFQTCGLCWRRDGEWHQEGCPADRLPSEWIQAERDAML